MNDAERFEQIFLSQVTRPGADKLLEWLKSTDFFTAPASTRFHGAYPGGLVKHSLNVYYAAAFGFLCNLTTRLLLQILQSLRFFRLVKAQNRCGTSSDLSTFCTDFRNSLQNALLCTFHYTLSFLSIPQLKLKQKSPKMCYRSILHRDYVIC